MPTRRWAMLHDIVSNVSNVSNAEKMHAGRCRRGSPQLLSINLRSNDVGYARRPARAARARRRARDGASEQRNVSDDAIRELEEVLRENRRNAACRRAETKEKKAPEASYSEREDVRRAVSLRRRRLRDEDAAHQWRRCASAEWRIPSSAWT